MTPAESLLLSTLQVSDPAVRKEIEDIIRSVVTDELNKIVQNQPGTSPIVQQLLYQNRTLLESFALSAMKKFWRDQTPGVYT